MRLFMFAASLRTGSFNKKLIQIAAQIVKESGHVVDLADYQDFELPIYNADVQNEKGFPQPVHDFIRRMQESDGLIIASPEYNFSMPGTLKNLIDWVSRVTPMPWKDQQTLLMSASPSMVGGNRGLWNTRVPLECCGSFVFPDMFSLAKADQAFDADGSLKDPAVLKRLEKNIKSFLASLEKVKNN